MNQNISLILTYSFYVVAAIQFIYYAIIFGRLVFFHKETSTSSSTDLEPVSVVIVARNEYLNLKKFLPKILEQDYPEFEVIVVNHASNDETTFLIKELQSLYPHLKYVDIKKDINFFKGKKFPLSMGIKSAKNDLLLFTDADCMPVSNQWIKTMAGTYGDNTNMVLGYGAYESKKSFLNKIIRYDTIRVALTYMSFAKWGIPYMGVGRNLSYRKQLFYDQGGFISHYRIKSGDDDLFVNKAAKGKYCNLTLDKNATTVSICEDSFANWFAQKRRHLSTGHNYKFIHLFLLGILDISTVLFFALAITLLCINPLNYIAISILLLRIILLLIITKKFMIITNERNLFVLLPALEIILILLIPVIIMSNLLLKQRKWK